MSAARIPLRAQPAPTLRIGELMVDDHSIYCRGASRAVDLLRGKWRIQILCTIRVGPVRLGLLARQIPSASKKVLTANLRVLELSGIIVRRDLSDKVRHVEYNFAEALRPAITSILDHLGKFGEDHLAQGDVQL